MTDTLSMTFDEVAELYDAVRPAYPLKMVEAVSAVLQGTPGRILEIGCGTGQATLPFARQGRLMTALEPGKNLSLIAVKNLAAFPNVRIETTTFEKWPVAEGQYDLVMSATAFHWVSPETRYTKSAQALAKGGWLALFWNREAYDETVLGQQIQALYDTCMPRSSAHPYATHCPGHDDKNKSIKTSQWQEEISHSRLFGEVQEMQFPWSEWYPTEKYLQLLETYSDHRTLPPENKYRLFDGIAKILSEHGGGRNKPYLTVLYLAQAQQKL